MRTDMSQDAIHGRLREMGELWELSLALMGSQTLDGSDLRRPNRHASIIQESIRKILVEEWDPIGIEGIREAIDEYDAYIGPLYRMLVDGGTVDEIKNFLADIERSKINIVTSDETRRHVADDLLRLQAELAGSSSKNK